MGAALRETQRHTTTTPGVSSWPSYGHDGANTRYNAAETTISPANVATLVKKWTTRDNADLDPVAVTSTPAVVNGVVYFGDWNGHLNAFNVADGTTVWSSYFSRGP